MPLVDIVCLRSRVVIPSLIDPLKPISPIDHSRPRSVTLFFVTALGGLIAYGQLVLSR